MEGRGSQLKKIVFAIFVACVLSPAGAGTGLYMGPYFPSPQPRNITVHQNTVAYLPCTVSQLGDKSVSWVRQRDADILTVDRYTFVRDDRLTVHFTPDTGTWTLVIKYVQERDAGTYECQISTEPKMSMLVHLNVIVPQVEISGAVDKYVRSGSTARLECKVSSTVQLPDYIFWYHSGSRLLEYDHPRIKISVSRRGGQGSEMSITSTLVITKARPSDAGNYTCLPSNLHNATTVLHVLNDEHPAAMQTGAAMLTDPPNVWGILLVVALALMFVQAHPHLAHTSLPPPALRLPDSPEDEAKSPKSSGKGLGSEMSAEFRVRSLAHNNSAFVKLQLKILESGADGPEELGVDSGCKRSVRYPHHPRQSELERRLRHKDVVDGFLCPRNPEDLKGRPHIRPRKTTSAKRYGGESWSSHRSGGKVDSPSSHADDSSQSSTSPFTISQKQEHHLVLR